MTERGRDGAVGATGARGPEGKRGRDTNNPAVWALAFALVLCFSLLAIATHRNATAIAVGRRALCAQKQDIGSRLKQTNMFIDRLGNAKSIDLGGATYTRTELLKSQADLQREADNLKDVTCG